MQSDAFGIRAATPADIPALMDMKLQLARSEDSAHALRSTEKDWLRLGFGPNARFTAFIAEQHNRPIGMVTCCEHYYTGWPEPAAYIGDLFVDPAHRRQGVARALLGRVAERTLTMNSPMIELTVHAGNAARDFYRRCGFVLVDNCLHYVAGQTALAALVQAARTTQRP